MENKKAETLIAILEERYKALHIIRGRVQSIGIWSLGLLLAAGGWILQSQIVLSCQQKTLYVIGLIFAFIALRFMYFKDLEKGFKGQQQAAVRIEKALKLYEPGFYDETEEPIYSKEWQHAGTGLGVGQFFKTTYLLLYVGFAFLLIAILICTPSREQQQTLVCSASVNELSVLS